MGEGPNARRPTVDFDHNSLAWLAERHAQNAELRERCPVVWNPRYGGFWMVTGYEEVAAVARDSVTFTPLYEPGQPEGIDYIGILGIPRPEGIPPAAIAESAGSHHAGIRRTLNPFLLPPAVDALRPFMQQSASWFLDQRISDGRMDIVTDFTNPVPAVLTMKMTGLPCDSWERYAEVFHATVAYGQDDPERRHAMGLVEQMVRGLTEVIAERRERLASGTLDPGEDMLSALLAMRDDGEPIGDAEMIGILWNLIGGGLDTTTSLTSLALHHLDRHPDLRRRLVEEPALLVPACEEYLRWTSVNETLTRTCTADTELGGQTVKRGEWVMMSWLGANFDPAVFDHPDEVDIDRAPNPHLAFGVGAHRCIGMHLARTMFEVMMREVLTRIPDYRVDHAATRFYRGNPELNGVVRMPVTFTPGTVVGAPRPF